MAGDTDQIFEFKEKVDFLIEELYRRKEIDGATMEQFATYINLPRSTINGPYYSNEYNGFWTISKNIQNAIRMKLGIPENAKGWKLHWCNHSQDKETPFTKRTDTADSFKTYILGFLDGPKKIKVCAKDTVLWSEGSHFAIANIDGGGQAQEMNTDFPILAECSFTPFLLNEERLEVNLGMVRLTIAFTNAPKARATDRLHINKEADKKSGSISLQAHGTERMPSWLLQATKGCLTHFLTTEKPLFNLVNVSVGDVFRVILSANPLGTSLRRSSGAQFSNKNKELIRQRLDEKRMGFEQEEDGWFILCYHDVDIENAEDQ